MARNTTSPFLLLAVLVAAALHLSTARNLSNVQASGSQRQLTQYPTYGKSIGGATVDNNVGWGNANAEGFNAVEGVQCAAGLTQCSGRGVCFDLQTNPLYCGSCTRSCDFYSQECKAGTCACKEGFSPCAARGGRCLDAASCPAGPGTDGAAADINTQGVGGMLGTIG